MSNEIKALARLALVNAFWHDFSELVNAYLEAGENLDVETLKLQLSETTSVYSISDTPGNEAFIDIWTENSDGCTTGHPTLQGALEHEDALEIYLQGNQIFKRHKYNNEWKFVS